jgi:orotate phosphoribosyltransferase
MDAGDRVLLVEDLTTDGGSKLSFVDAIRETGASCATRRLFSITAFSPKP